MSPRASRYQHASHAIQRRSWLLVAVRSAANTCGISCAHGGQIAGLPVSPRLLAARTGSLHSRAVVACSGVSRSLLWSAGGQQEDCHAVPVVAFGDDLAVVVDRGGLVEDDSGAGRDQVVEVLQHSVAPDRGPRA